MSKFKIGDKVETPFGVGVVESIDCNKDFYIEFKNNSVIYFDVNDIQPCKSAHDKLLELGWVEQKGLAEHIKMYAHEDYDTGLLCINKDIKKWFYSLLTYTDFFVDLELSKILTQYLEELENEKI